ncbi:MAG TPA: hypothetical protein DCY93_01740 [Firmicutes bacterium]|nr:hypothetical protein [Bacillota bacterium]
MNKSEIIRIANENNGYIYLKLIKKYGIPTTYLTQLVKEGLLSRVARGIYITRQGIEDELFIYSLTYHKIIYTGETALFLNNLSNKQIVNYEATIPYGTNIPEIKGVKIKQSRKKTLFLGVTEVQTSFGNYVRTYDKERCICDLFKRNDYDYESVIYAINEYKDNYLNIKKLYEYAKELKVYEKVRNVFEVIGWN